MGRRKISIQPITDERNRKVTFVKRKAGLFKKAHELAVLCQVDLAVIILGKNHTKFFEYTSSNVDELLERFKTEDVIHDTKTPEDYGDYQLMSRVGNTLTMKGHQRSASMMSTELYEESDDEDEDDEDEDDDTEEKEQPPQQQQQQQQQRGTKKRKTTPLRSTRSRDQKQENQVPRSLQPAPQVMPSQQGQHQLQQQLPLQLPIHNAMYDQTSYSHFQESQQRMIPQQWGHAPPTQNTAETVPASQSAQYHYQFPITGSFVQQQQQHQLQQNQLQQQHQQLQQGDLPQHRQQLQTSHSLQSPPIIGPGQPSQITITQQAVADSTYTRARSLNNNISKRPILRVEIPTTEVRQSQKDGGIGTTAAGSVPGSSKGDTTSANHGEKTPPGGREPDEPKGLGILSSGSTPLSATLPSGLFNLPPPHPSQPKMGEQTPLTGGLPSRYVPDLFPSPSNFYSNDWNIPYGSGSTPYPTSANHQLPPRARRHLTHDVADSPLQGHTKDSRLRDLNQEMKDQEVEDSSTHGDEVDHPQADKRE